MSSVAKKNKPERGRPKGRKPKYTIHTGIEVPIGLDLEQYMLSQQYEPKMKAVIERAIKLLFREDKFVGNHASEYGS
jgi:hypothetical protein